MLKVAVMGDYDSIYGFQALGLDIYPVDEKAKAEAILKKLYFSADCVSTE